MSRSWWQQRQLDRNFKYSQLVIRDQQLSPDHSLICLSILLPELVHHTITQQLWQWLYILPTLVWSQIRSSLSTTSLNPLLHTLQDTWSSCHEKDSLNQWHLENSTIKSFQTRIQAIQLSMNFI